MLYSLIDIKTTVDIRDRKNRNLLIKNKFMVINEKLFINVINHLIINYSLTENVNLVLCVFSLDK